MRNQAEPPPVGTPASSGGVEAWTDLFQPLLWHMGLHP